MRQTGTPLHDAPAAAPPRPPVGAPPQGGGPRPPRRWSRVLRWTAAGLTLVLLGAGIAVYLYLGHLNRNLTKEERHLGDSTLDKPPPNAAGQSPLNILLLGTDDRSGAANQELGGAREDADRPGLADTQILLHVAADRSHITAVSVPRDTRVTIPSCTDPHDGTTYQEMDHTINASLAHGGPGCTVATWERLTGIYIDHFMMVDFAGVVSMADAVGGVPVCVTDNIHDPDSGLRLAAGENVVRGRQALQWLRTRHGFENGSDIGRATAQQIYLTAMAKQLQEGTKLTDPGQLTDLAEAATSALTVDSGLGTVNKLYDLGRDIRRVPSDAITMLTMPWVPDPSNPNHVRPEPGEAERVFAAIRNDVALDDEAGQREAARREAARAAAEAEQEAADADPAAQIPVSVRNGTAAPGLAPVTGRAAEITTALHHDGFPQAVTDTTPASQDETTLTYPGAEQRPNAMAVARALGLPATAVQESSQTSGLRLVIGADWPEGTTYPESSEPEQTPAPDAPNLREPGSRTANPQEKAILDTHEAVTGKDDNPCMTVNPAYIW